MKQSRPGDDCMEKLTEVKNTTQSTASLLFLFKMTSDLRAQVLAVFTRFHSSPNDGQKTWFYETSRRNSNC